MGQLARSFASIATAVAILSSCGGETTPPPPPPPPSPANVAKQPGGDTQTANIGQLVATPPAVKVTTATGAALAGVSVTFAVASGGGSLTGATPSTGADGVATVGSWTLGPAAGPNTLTATVAGSGIAGNPATFSATGVLPSFNPTGNTSLSGTQAFTSVNIPAGVTVTMTGDLTLNATGAVTIAGNIVGDCLNLTINAEGALTVSGNLDNGCNGAIPAAGPPAMTLVGKGGYTFNGPGSFTAGGDVKITNDPTLSDANFAPGTAPSPSNLRVNGGFPSVGEPCINNGYSGTAKPATAKNGNDGNPNGTIGADGSTWTLQCKGGSDIVISGSLTLTGQNGGKGGNGTHTSSSAAVSNGGSGGKGGAVKIQAIGGISIGAGSLIKTGNGGVGGNASADGSSGHGGDVGASGTATGGAGGSPGLFTAVAKTGSIAFNGALNLQIGTGGRGGDASAIGGDGHDALPCPPAVGGPATATAGVGGSTPDKTLTSAGAVTGLGNVTVTGGTPGVGGNATATAGKGGAGAETCKPGAIGGGPTAKGGKGGDADLKNQSGAKVANGGNGGSMEVKNGKGGQGWNDCVLPTFVPGGAGGMGGSIAGFNGAFGTGLANGTAGAASYTTVANGGNGGDGQGPGAGGPPGGNGVVLNGGVTPTIVAPSFQPGLPGLPCAGISLLVTPSTQTVTQGGSGSVQLVITRTGTFTGPITIQIKDQGGTVRGSGTIASGSTQASVSFTVPANEPAGTRTWTATASGTGVPDATQNVGLTVTGPGGTTNLTIQNNEHATRPWTKVLSKTGTGAYQSHTVAADGSTTVPVPSISPAQMEILIQQAIANDRITYVYQMSSLDLLTYGHVLGITPKGTISFTVSGLPPNSKGISFAGNREATWPATNTSPFNIMQSRVPTGFSIVGGCTMFGLTDEPVNAILGLSTYLDGGFYGCDFSGMGVKAYTSVQTTVNGVGAGTQLSISGGLHREDLHTMIYSKNFSAPTTNYYALNGMDLPSGVMQWEKIGRTTASTEEEIKYYFTNPFSWTVALPQALNTPTINIASTSLGYYEFDIVLAFQSLYQGAWSAKYTQANGFGGTNKVTHLVLRSYFGSSVPSLIHIRSPSTTLLDAAFMPQPPGFVFGVVSGYNYNLFARPQLGDLRIHATRLNVAF